MDKSKKIYIKALDKYNNGYIDDAIQLCEKSISIDMTNAAAINLKGLLYYLKGDLDGAQKLWKMNYQINKDSVSEKYLNDTKQDKERLKIYSQAVQLVEGLKINEALRLLKVCEESDYNYINTNNYITSCYISIGEYDKALKHIENVLKLDKTNDTAKENRRTLEKYGVIKKNIDFKIIAYSCMLMACIAILIMTTFIYRKKIRDTYASIKYNISKSISKASKSNKQAQNIEATKANSKTDVKTTNNNEKNNKTETNKTEKQNFNSEALKKYVQSRNYEGIYDLYMSWKDKEVPDNDKVVLSTAYEVLQNEGVNYFYNNGCIYLNNANYSNAKDYLGRAYSIGSQSYLCSHIVYMFGTSYDLSGDRENAARYYTEYINAFPSGGYAEQVLYNLVTIYKNTDKSKAKVYGEKLVQLYPYSIYNNSVVKSIINN
ncbi:hypothetical protein [Clostridium sp. DJ247]|uniref:hypothetical protein n=1 Tax=Clostridium sp. DJ247 TaxID=2726188 RepID=UPI0016291E60|nr:hypothetical protein [Clostridium sp. DJ247]MBC2579611.1 hypothetical protein [Clostridium sp. DJ247]